MLRPIQRLCAHLVIALDIRTVFLKNGGREIDGRRPWLLSSASALVDEKFSPAQIHFGNSEKEIIIALVREALLLPQIGNRHKI